MERLGDFRVCLKDLSYLKPPFNDQDLQIFYEKHGECHSGKVTSPRAKEFYASLFAERQENERQERQQQQTIIQWEEERDVEEVCSEEEDVDESEEEEEEAETEMIREREEDMVERTHELETAIAAINNEPPAPSLVDFDWSEFNDWISNMEQECEKEKEKENLSSPINEKLSTPNKNDENISPPVLETLSSQNKDDKDESISTPVVPENASSDLTSVFIPLHSSQAHSIIKL